MAVGRVKRVPRLTPDEASVVPASMLNISLGADHRCWLAHSPCCWGG